VEQLELAPIEAGDSVRILIGVNKGSVGVVTYQSEKGELFVQMDGEGAINLLHAGECGKV
jgi:hypothetical protein